MTLAEFKADLQAGTITLTPYPAGSPTSGPNASGFFVAHTTQPGTTVDIVSYGYYRGAVRRVRGSGRSLSVFDWAAVYTINPSLTASGNWDNAGSNYSWQFVGSSSVVGASGGEGRIDFTEPNSPIQAPRQGFFDGPVVLAGPHARWGDDTPAPKSSTPDNLMTTVSDGIPSGHPGGAGHSHPLANPWIRVYSRSLDVPTADQSANEWALSRYGVTTTAGVEFFRSMNHNATGVRYLAWDGLDVNSVREINGGPSDALNDYRLINQDWPNNTNFLRTAPYDMQPTEQFYGLRIYPGDYFLEQVDMQPSNRLWLRTMADAGNPNPGQTGNPNVRFWIGHRTSGNDYNQSFSYQTVMEDPTFASRFRVYIASTGSVNVSGTNDDPPPPFRVNMLNYNIDPNYNGGRPYGDITFTSSTYLFGSLISWKVKVGGSTVVEKEAPELGPDDRLTYVIDAWTELM